MSLLLGQTVTKVTSEYPDVTAEQIAVAFSIMTGAIAMFIGLVRLGILVDFIPAPAISGFMTGSAITISIGQWPKLFGTWVCLSWIGTPKDCIIEKAYM